MDKNNKHNKPLDAQSLTFNNHEWISACGHELRIPIAQIENCTEILDIDLSEPFLDEKERKQYLDNIKSANRSLSLLVEDLIDGAKNANHSFSVNCQSVNLKEIITQIHHTLAPSAKIGVALILKYDDNAPALAYADPQRIKQVISNLVRNAIKFTEKGTITISVQQNAKYTDLIDVSITDTGIGMDSEQVKRVWDAFTKVYDTEKMGDNVDAEKGLGLGLALSSNMIAKMGGEISVDSTPGVGSTFCFSLKAST